MAKEIKRTTPNSKSSDSVSPIVLEELTNLIKQQFQHQIDNINTQIAQSAEQQSAQRLSLNTDTKNHIETVEQRLNKKLDGVDEALRGNGRVGIFEQIRGIKQKIQYIFICLLILFGFKVWGLGFDEWVQQVFHKQTETNQSQTQTNTDQQKINNATKTQIKNNTDNIVNHINNTTTAPSTEPSTQPFNGF